MSDSSTVRTWLEAPHHAKQWALLDKFEMDLRLGRLTTGYPCTSFPRIGPRLDRRAVTIRTVELLKAMIGGTRWKTPLELINVLQELGRELHSAGGFREPAIGNVVRRIIAAVREEVANGGWENVDCGNSIQSDLTMSRTKQHDRSLERMLWALPQHVKPTRGTSSHRRPQQNQRLDTSGKGMETDLSCGLDFSPQFHQNRQDFKQSLMEAIEEITSDLEDLHKNINDQATNHIHAGEVVLAYGQSRTIKMFLKAAADKKLQFTVVICEDAPHYEGHEMAVFLAEAGIECVCIPDAALYAMMARINKVLVPAHAVLANGGLVAPSGCNMVVLAANQNSVPVVCLTDMFKLTPLFPHEGQDTLNDFWSPMSVVGYSQWNMEISMLAEVDFVNPVHDYIRPELISLYVTNVGSFQPSYVYRLLAEYYQNDSWKVSM